MYERSYGYRYAELGDHPTAAEVAKAIRGDIKQAVGEGLLPAAWSYSVRSETFSGGCSVDVTVRDCPDGWQECDGTVPGSRHEIPGHPGVWSAQSCPDVWCAGRNDPQYAHGARVHQTLTEEARVAKMTLERIHNAYNHDGSEIMVDYHDVRYYGIVSFESVESAEWRKGYEAGQAQDREARKNGAVVGKVTNYKRDGSRVTHLVVETTEGRKVLACGARSWRGSTIGTAADDAVVTCSRCAKREAAV